MLLRVLLVKNMEKQLLFLDLDMSRYLTMWILRDESSFTPVWIGKKEQRSHYYRPIGFLTNGRYLIRPKRNKRVFLMQPQQSKVM